MSMSKRKNMNRGYEWADEFEVWSIKCVSMFEQFTVSYFEPFYLWFYGKACFKNNWKGTKTMKSIKILKIKNKQTNKLLVAYINKN